MSRAALVYNPTKVTDVDDLLAAVVRRGEASGWDEPLLYATTEEDPGRGMAEEAIRRGADVVLAAGGDGTVRAAITALVGTPARLALLPAGTGNLLARNLNLVGTLDAALEVAFAGADRVLDVGWVDGAGAVDRAFAVMAGVGFDADMMADAPPRLKSWFGWPAYAVSGARHLTDRGFDVELRIDDQAPIRRRARGVLVANVGRLQAGLQLFPDAEPDDGTLEVGVLAPRGVAEWAGLTARVMRRRHDRSDRRLETFRGREIAIRTERPQSRELDGDPIEDADHLVVAVRPRALTVKVPATT